MSKYDDFLKKLLKDKWSILGNELAAELVARFGVESENARKIVQRAAARGILISSTPLTFGKGQFLYLKPGLFFGLRLVKDASERSRKPLYRLLEVLDQRRVVSFYEGMKITASPEERSSSKVSMIIDMAKHLEKLGIVSIQNDSRGEHYLVASGSIPSLMRKHFDNNQIVESHYQAMKLDALFIPDVLRWMKRMNMIDGGLTYRNISSPGTGVKHNEVMWDAFAYTKATGINPIRASLANSEEKQTLVVFDVLINRKYLQVDLDGFLARVQINLNSVRQGERKVMPIVVFKEIDELTLNRLRKLGFLAVDVKVIFGNNIISIISNLRQILSHKSDDTIENIEPTLQAIEETGHTDQLRALRGALFEALMFPVIQRFYPNSQPLQGRKLVDPKSGKPREFDLILISSHPKEIILVELKGYTGKSYISLGDRDKKDSLKYFFRGSVQVGYNYYRESSEFVGYAIKAVYMTTGKFHSDTTKFITEVKEGGLRATMLPMFFDGESLIQFLETGGFQHEAKIIKRYYAQADDD